MRATRPRRKFVPLLALALAAAAGGTAGAQDPGPYMRMPRWVRMSMPMPMRGPMPVMARPGGTYGPRMSFGQFGYRMNMAYAFGNPYGGLGVMGYGFGAGFGPQFPPGGGVVYSSAYTTPGAPPMSGYYPPFAVYGWTFQTPAVFPPGSPNWGGPGR